MHRYFGATELVHGPGSLAKLAEEASRLGGTRATLVSDRGLAGAGLVDRATAVLAAASFPVDVVLDVPVDPTFDDVDRLVAAIRAHRSDIVIALGSGSVLAAGRAAAVAATHDGPALRIAGVEKSTHPPLLTIAIPTTAGSGGEVSRQATITDPSGHKSGVLGRAVAARVAILDAELLTSVPRRQAVASGVDALVHALEAYVSKRATPLTDALALSSFEEIFRDLPGSLGSRDVAVLDRLLLSSTMANLACGNAGLGLVHGLNKGITYLFHTGRYATLSYGDLHSVLLPWVWDFNAPAAPARFATLARLMGATAAGDEAAAREGGELLRAWLAALDAPRRLPWDGCPPEDMAIIESDVLGRQMALDNPRAATAEDLRALVEASVRGW